MEQQGSELKEKKLKDSIEFVRGHLNQQGPLEYFVHHNPLHSLESRNFHDALHEANLLYDSKGYMSCEDYLYIYRQNQISSKALLDEVKACFSGKTIRNLNGKTVQRELDPSIIVSNMLKSTRDEPSKRHQSGRTKIEKIIRTQLISHSSKKKGILNQRVEFRSYLEKRNINLNEWVTFYFGHMLSVYFDSGQAYWPITYQDKMLKTFAFNFGRKGWFSKPWKKSFQMDLIPYKSRDLKLEDLVCLLDELRIQPEHYAPFLFDLCQNQKGWAGFILYLENSPNLLYSNTKITSSFEEYLFLLVLMEKSLVTHYYGEFGKTVAPKVSKRSSFSPIERAISYAYQLLDELGVEESGSIAQHEETLKNVCEIAVKLSLDEHKIWQNAFDKSFTSNLVTSVCQNNESPHIFSEKNIHAQAVFCIDEREESFRRHVEEVNPNIETYGFAGNFTFNIRYKGPDDIQYRQLGNLAVPPEYQVEERLIEQGELTITRRVIQLFYYLEAEFLQRPKDFLFGWITSLTVGFILIPHLILKVYFPYYEEKIRKYIERLFKKGLKTSISVKTVDGGEIAPKAKAEKLKSLLAPAGMKHFSDFVFIVGHGSHSLNNPHEAAHDCGACGGGRGYANAKLFVDFANDPLVRSELSKLGILIPKKTIFIGSYHDTCSDEFLIFNEQWLRFNKKNEFLKVKATFIEACKRDAHERCRKFSDVPLSINADAAQKHVIGRANDLSQPRPEYGHATNAICVVGTRTLTKGMFLDRRSFLCSYDYRNDEELNYLPSLLDIIVTVCSGINLEYYFATIDNNSFGSGTKLPHNVVSLQGVINGTDSDLLLGLPTQMIEIHAPLRLNLLIEAPISLVNDILKKHSGSFSNLTENEWIIALVFDPETRLMYQYQEGQFEKLHLTSHPIRIATSSLEAYKNRRGFVEFSRISTGSVSC